MTSTVRHTTFCIILALLAMLSTACSSQPSTDDTADVLEAVDRALEIGDNDTAISTFGSLPADTALWQLPPSVCCRVAMTAMRMAEATGDDTYMLTAIAALRATDADSASSFVSGLGMEDRAALLMASRLQAAVEMAGETDNTEWLESLSADSAALDSLYLCGHE